MSARNRNLIIAAVLAAAAATGGTLYYQMVLRYIRTVDGVIVHVDAAARKAAIEVTDPDSGGAVEFNGDVPADCPITIDGRDATLAEVRVGDRATVKGRMSLGPRVPGKKREKHVTADWVRITRGPVTSR